MGASKEDRMLAAFKKVLAEKGLLDRPRPRLVVVEGSATPAEPQHPEPEPENE